ncbi:MAG: hypothetical protein ABJH05_17600 [Fulvivirga sp.]
MKQSLTVILLSLCFLCVGCNSGSKVEDQSTDDIDLEWDETGLEEDSIYEDAEDIKDEDIIDDESEVINEKAD